MDKKFHTQPRGQSLVLLAGISIALLIFMALIIDGGNAYAMRRLAQNASDAGAMAGARTLCVTGNQALARASANSYAVQNNEARLANLVSQTANVSVADGLVDVITSIQYTTFFARIIGMEQMTAVAEAQAGCFNPGAGEGIIPIAWKCLEPGPDTPPDIDCDLTFADEDENCALYDEDYKYYVFINSPDVPFVCEEWDPETQYPEEPYIVLVCDTNDDGTIDIEIVNTLQPQKSWMWVDLTGSSADAADLKEIVKGDDDVSIKVPVWVQDASGNKVAIYDAVYDYHDDDTIAVPVYDKTCMGPDPSDPDNLNCEPKYDGEPVILSTSRNDGTHNFRIVTFALFHVACVESGSHGPCPGRTALNTASAPTAIGPQYNTFEGCFRTGFFSGLSGIPSDGGVNAGAWTIYLTK